MRYVVMQVGSKYRVAGIDGEGAAQKFSIESEIEFDAEDKAAAYIDSMMVVTTPTPPSGGDDGTSAAKVETETKAEGDGRTLCFAVDLSADPAIVALQDAVKIACDGIAGTWNAPDSFHVTLAYIPGDVDDETAAKLIAVAESVEVPALVLELGEAGAFETPDGFAVHYRIADHAALNAYQAALYTALTGAGAALSEYSVPGDYKPHVTMGYLESAPPPLPAAEGVVTEDKGVLAWHGTDNEVWHQATAAKTRRSMLERVADGLRAIGILPEQMKGVKGLAELFEKGGIKSIGKGLFIGAFTNNFRDRDGEIITGRAIDGMIERMKAGIIPYPELWYKHLPYTKHGKAFFIARAGNIAYCVGRFDKSPLGDMMEKFYAKTPGEWAMSHGFEFPTWGFDETTKEYSVVNTFEISVLKPEIAANLITPFKSIGAINMGLSAEDIKKLAQETNPEIAKVIAAEHKKFEKLSGTVKTILGTDYKNFTKANKAEGDEEAAAEEEKPTEEKADLEAIGSLIEDMIGAQADTMELVTAMAEHMQRLTDRLAEMQTALGMEPEPASEVVETVVEEASTDDAEKRKKAADALARKKAGANTPFADVSILDGLFS